jgi:hypothetical protein
VQNPQNDLSVIGGVGFKSLVFKQARVAKLADAPDLKSGSI